MILLFYYFRYGGHLSHRTKPEWDTVPDIVKRYVFAKATVDDLVAIEMVMKRPVQAILEHDDAESMKSWNRIFLLTGIRASGILLCAMPKVPGLQSQNISFNCW